MLKADVKKAPYGAFFTKSDTTIAELLQEEQKQASY